MRYLIVLLLFTLDLSFAEEDIEIQQKNLSHLIHETIFDREYIERDLDSYHESQKELNLEEEVDSKELGVGVEVHWNSYKN